MAEVSDQAVCEEAVYDENFMDYIREYALDFSSLYARYHPVCIRAVNRRYAVMYVAGKESVNDILQSYNISMIPSLYGLMDTSSLESTGILSVQRSPYLNLTGQGVMVGIIDTGIDYGHPAFTYEDKTSKIRAIWDQTVRTGTPPEHFYYGSEFTQMMINQALQSDDPLAVVPSVDELGHGTFLAGIAAGRSIPEAEFSGAAPNAALCVVKLKPCKQYLRTFYGIESDVPAYQENDIMLAIAYCMQKAAEAQMPLVLMLGLGTNSGGHTGESYLCRLIDDYSGSTGIAVLSATGNEGNARHHYRGHMQPTDPYDDVEIRVGSQSDDFSIELWSLSPQAVYTIDIISPTGERTERIVPAQGGLQSFRFLLYPTELLVNDQTIEALSGNQMIFVHFSDPAPGIWTLRVYSSSEIETFFDIWMPVSGFISDEIYFLRPDPEITLSETATAREGIAVGACNHVGNSLYIASGRGFTASGLVQPDLVAPGVSIHGPIPGNRYSDRTGTSVAAALAAGASALLMEWGIVKENDPLMNNRKLWRYLTLGAERRVDISYPNPSWGYGVLNLNRTFNKLVTDHYT